MGNRALKYGAVLIGTYLVVVYATGFGKAVGAASKGAVGITKALQGR
jgi:hypothetical protein